MKIFAPNLFLIGTQKGGSTSLFRYLCQHPNISSLGTKEPNIFSANSLTEVKSRLSNYSFDLSKHKYYIDGSPNYTRYPRFSNTAENINTFCEKSQVRFIYILRNPVERLISNYFWNAQNFGESRSLENAIQKEEQYIQTSLYDVQIEEYLKFFALEQFYFLTLEQFKKNPFDESNKIFLWLELDCVDNLCYVEKLAQTQKVVT